MYKFTVAIPTYNSSAYLKECILGFRNSTHIDEIIIGDDCSNEIEVEKIKLIINEVKKIMTCKISFIGNKENIGAFKNKYNLILNSRNQLVYQIDSDNVPFRNIDQTIKDVINDVSDESFIYLPSKLIQFRKYKNISRLASFFIKKYRVNFSNKILVFDKTITKKAVLENIEYEKQKAASNNKATFPELRSDFVNEKHIFWVLNCGNFIVNKEMFLSKMKEGLTYDRKLLSMDAVAFSFLWLKSGGKIKILPSLAHHHRKRFDSVSYHEKEDSVHSRNFFVKEIKNLF
jgi:glycosyltransferase involved in cell wall biosynthesis